MVQVPPEQGAADTLPAPQGAACCQDPPAPAPQAQRCPVGEEATQARVCSAPEDTARHEKTCSHYSLTMSQMLSVLGMNRKRLEREGLTTSLWQSWTGPTPLLPEPGQWETF